MQPDDMPPPDGLMSCPCGRGDYDLCRHCPYHWCSVHSMLSPERLWGIGEYGYGRIIFVLLEAS